MRSCAEMCALLGDRSWRFLPLRSASTDIGCGPMSIVELPVSSPRLRALRWTTDLLHVSVKEHHIVARLERGRVESFTAGQVFRSEPRSIHLKAPGDVYREIGRDGPGVYTIVQLRADDVAKAIDGRAAIVPHMASGDERARPFHHLVDAVLAGADHFTMEVVLAEALGALGRTRPDRLLQTRPVRRAAEFLRERLAGPVSLDELAAHVGRDKFYLCRMFRAQVGLPPHAYLTHLRVVRARQLLARGTRPSEVARNVGFYDQSQLTRHFRRITGVTPARYARDLG